MKNFTMYLLVLSTLTYGAFAQAAAGPVPINLGNAGKFALLAGSGVTNVSSQTYIIGNVGSSPTPAITGLIPAQVKGQLFLVAGTPTSVAQTDLTTAYNQAAGAACNIDLTGKDLGGMTLVPGVYCFSSSAGLTGKLTLDAQGNANSQWIFQIGSTLTAASNSRVVVLLGKSQPQPLSLIGLGGCNVFWQVGSSATIGTGSTFVGNILALTSITLNGGTYRGKALAGNGAITMSDRMTVDGPQCVTAR